MHRTITRIALCMALIVTARFVVRYLDTVHTSCIDTTEANSIPTFPLEQPPTFLSSPVKLAPEHPKSSQTPTHQAEPLSIFSSTIATAHASTVTETSDAASLTHHDTDPAYREYPPVEPVLVVAAPVQAAPAVRVSSLIPESAWPDSHRIRSPLTPEIASKYSTGKFRPRTLQNTAWGVGESLTYSVDYGFYKAGTATMSVIKTEWVNGGECYHIQTRAVSNDFISSFYTVNDTVNSYIDKAGIFSRRFEKKLSEGDYRAERYVDFYVDRNIAIQNTKKKTVTEIPLYAQDVLSSLYMIRVLPLAVGTDITVTTYADGKAYPLTVKVHRKETIEVPAGKFRCFVVEPLLQSDGIFRQKGKLTVWLSDDEYRIPVKMTSKIVIGSIGTNLVKYVVGKPR